MNGVLRVSYIHTGFITVYCTPRLPARFSEIIRATSLVFFLFSIGAAVFSGVSSEQLQDASRRVTTAVYIYMYERSFTVEFLLPSLSAVFSTMSRQFSSGKILYLRPGPVPLNGTNHLNRHSLSKYTHLCNAAETIRFLSSAHL